MIKKYWPYLRRQWFSALVVVGMVAAAVELIIRRNASDAPTTSLWIGLPLIVIGIAPLLWWRRYRFGAPAAFFVINALESFVDGRLVIFTAATFFGVLSAVFLFGILEDRRQAIAGLGIAFAAGGGVTSNHPTQGWGDFVGVALLFSVVWLAAFALGRNPARRAEAVQTAPVRCLAPDTSDEADRRGWNRLNHVRSTGLLRLTSVRHGTVPRISAAAATASGP